MSEAWDELVRAALMGTARKGYAPTAPGPSSAVDQIVAEIAAAAGEAGSATESALLRVAGVLAVADRAGRLPSRLGETGAAAVAEDRAPVDAWPRVGDRAASRLRRLLKGKQASEVMVEWLGLCAQAERRVPEELLVPLLDYARYRPELHEAVARVIGERGRWLAKRGNAWRFVLKQAATPVVATAAPTGDIEALQATFETGGDLLSRTMALREARLIDAAAARAWVEATLASEPVDNRAAIIAALAVGATVDDETLLESTLDDRGRSVQRASRDVLVLVPESAFVARMAERVFALVTVDSDDDEPLQVALPAACDKAMIRDGVDRKVPAGVKMGEKAWWLKQMVASLPLSLWTDRLDLGARTSRPRVAKQADPSVPAHRGSERVGRALPQDTPDAIVRAAVMADNAEPLLQGLIQSAERSGDVDWIRALLRHAGTRARGASAEGLLTRLPPSEREAFVREAWAAGPTPVPFGSRALGLVARLDHAWSAAFSTAFVDQIRGHVEARTKDADHTLGTLILSLGGNLHPAAAAALQATFDKIPAQSYLESAMREILTTIEFRQAMHDDFKDGA